jgi:hypothetical protein
VRAGRSQHCGAFRYGFKLFKLPQERVRTMSGTAHLPRETWIRRIGIALLLLVMANLLSWRFVDPDLWGHIQYGEDWIAEGELPRVASHTYSAVGHQWVNHENLSELVLAYTHRAFGGVGIMVAKLIAGMLLLVTLISLAVRRGIPVWAATVCVLPVASGLGEFWLARPQMASFLCMGVLLTILEFACPPADSKSNARPWMLWLCIPLMIVWANSHGGFAAGLCVLTAILGVNGLALLKTGMSANRRSISFLASTVVLAGAATLINPYGTGLITWMFGSLGKPRPEISEWASVLNGGVAAIPFAVLTVLSVVAMCGTRVRRDLARTIVLALVATQAAMHIRHIAFLAILFGFWMPVHCWSTWQRFLDWRIARTGRDPADDPPLTRNAFAMLGLEATVVGIILAGMLGWRLSNFGVDRSKYPVSAIAFMDQNDLDGRLIVTFNWAQYAIAALSPDTTVCFDGRFRTCYPQQVIDMNFDLTNGIENRSRSRGNSDINPDPARVLEFRDPQLVLLDRTLDRPGTTLMASTSGWTLLYRDQIAELWGRVSEFGSEDTPRFLPRSRRIIGDAPQTGIAAWPALPGRTGRMAFIVSRDPARVAKSATHLIR